jgi:hypothetical protein
MARRLGQSGSPGPPPGLRSWADPADLVRSARRKSARDSGQFGIGSARQHSRTPGRDSARGSVPARSRWGQLHDPHGPAACVRSAGHHRVRHGLSRGGRFGRPVENSFLVFGLLAPNRTLQATENRRVDGSIPALATISNSMIRNGFRALPAGYRKLCHSSGPGAVAGLAIWEPGKLAACPMGVPCVAGAAGGKYAACGRATAQSAKRGETQCVTSRTK